MLRPSLFALTVISVSACGVAGCTSRTVTFFSCKACLANDMAHCATYTPQCGDSSERTPSEAGATDALCDTLGPAELARRPTPEGYTPSPWLKNSCYAWPADAFTLSCTRIAKTCDSVPVH